MNSSNQSQNTICAWMYPHKKFACICHVDVFHVCLPIACFFHCLQQRCLEELDVLDQMSRLSIDPFQHNRRLSETNLLDLKGSPTCPTRSESHSVAQSPPPHLEITLLPKDYKEPDNPFQNDALPLWEKKRSAVSSKSKEKLNSHSNSSSPENNNYGGGQQHAYMYRTLNETPRSPELVNHRMHPGPSPPSPSSPEIIQVRREKAYTKSLCYFLLAFSIASLISNGLAREFLFSH